MKEYKIFENASNVREAVKQGWSWPACLFSGVWALTKKLNTVGAIVIGWWGLALIISVIIASGKTDRVVDAFGEMRATDLLSAISNGGIQDEAGDAVNSVLGLLNLLIAIICGVNGNAWRAKGLSARGYELKATITAETDEAAVASYIRRPKAG